MDYAKMGTRDGAAGTPDEARGQSSSQSAGNRFERSASKASARKCARATATFPTARVSCPVKNSRERSTIQFNTPTLYSGTKFENVRLVLKDGKIINATANNTKRLNEILDTDAGARYIGEFSLGFNPYILSPMCDILFDEKIAGSLHFTPGSGLRRLRQQQQECDPLGHGSDPAQGMGRRRGCGSTANSLIRKDGIFLPKDLRATAQSGRT